MSKMELSAKREGYGCSSCAFFFFFSLSAKWNEITQAVKYKVTVVIGLFITSIHPLFYYDYSCTKRSGWSQPKLSWGEGRTSSQFIAGPHAKKTTIHTGTLSHSQFRVPTVHVFRLLGESSGTRSDRSHVDTGRTWTHDTEGLGIKPLTFVCSSRQ